MNFRLKLTRVLGIAFLVTALALFVAPEIAEARRGGRSRSFGGSRRSRTSKSRSKSSTSKSTTPKRMTPSQRAASSFGGKRLSSSKAYTSKYGTPRKTQTRTVTGANGTKTNYVMHGYGGYGSSLMTGYMMGSTSWMWMMPFHPAFYYTRPYYADRSDGSVGVYPPTFSWSKVIFTLLVFGAIIYILYSIFKKKKTRSAQSTSSFG